MKLRCIAMLLCLTAAAAAKEQVLLNDEDIWKMYTTPEVALTEVNGDAITFGGVGIGTILNNHLWLGGAARITLSDITDDAGDEMVDMYDLWYAGLSVGYTFRPDSLVHFAAATLIGGGEAKLQDPAGGHDETEPFAVIEPSVHLLINLAETVELGFGLSYLYCTGADSDQLGDDDLGGLTGSVFFRVTEF